MPPIEEVKKNIENKVILITGGTGSFGNAVADRLLELNPKKIIIFSRDEKKQFDMGNKYNNPKIQFVIGDVRDSDTVNHAMRGVDLVFHAAALKQVPNCEFFPIEALKTNTVGAHHVLRGALQNGAEKVVILSTDKAVHPINVMGMTKALMERVMIAAAREKKGKTVFCGTRYGNVMYTRGSVIPYFIELMKRGLPLKVTNKDMTRFMMPLPHSVDLVLYALVNGKDGEIYVKKSPASTIGDLAEALVEIFNYDKGVEEIGIRPGEKKHEMLVSPEELSRTEDCGDFYKIRPEVPEIDYKHYYFKGAKIDSLPEEGYTSANTKRLNREELKELLLSLPEIQKELGSFGKSI
ncbi:MAG: SDR family NAD(P)-dependent oxidoreductase [Candidatus Sungiibacteriota bacterium]